MINAVMATLAAQEICMPSFTQDGGVAVAFFEGKAVKFCIPVGSEDEAVRLAVDFQIMICKAIARYEELCCLVRPPITPPPTQKELSTVQGNTEDSTVQKGS